jgi:hypothetical protein
MVADRSVRGEQKRNAETKFAKTMLEIVGAVA